MHTGRPETVRHPLPKPEPPVGPDTSERLYPPTNDQLPEAAELPLASMAPEYKWLAHVGRPVCYGSGCATSRSSTKEVVDKGGAPSI
jgi:hypothetical protein